MASTVRIVPAKLEAQQKKIIEETALKVFKVLNSFGLVRIDFMIDRKSGNVYCNEINTIPGSLAFYLWKHAGLEFDQECDEMIENALNRYALKAKKTYYLRIRTYKTVSGKKYYSSWSKYKKVKTK